MSEGGVGKRLQTVFIFLFNALDVVKSRARFSHVLFRWFVFLAVYNALCAMGENPFFVHYCYYPNANGDYEPYFLMTFLPFGDYKKVVSNSLVFV